MLNLIFSAGSAYNQVGLFFGALILFGIGGLLLGDSVYWRIHALRVSGTIIGVLHNNSMYTPVYRYQLPSGETHEAKSPVSTGSPLGYETGRAVSLLVSPKNPSEARTANNYVLDIIGVAMFAPGIWVAHTALTAYPITPMTWIMGAAMIFYFAERAHSLVKPGGPRISFGAWTPANSTTARTIDLASVKPAEQFLPAAGTETFSAQLKRSRAALPIVGLLAVAFASIGAYEGFTTARLEENGVDAPGAVVDLREESASHGGYTYYPIVQFRTRTGLLIQFKDSIGSDPPRYEPGDKVQVLYLPNDLREAIIDRGVWNWTIAVALSAGGILLGWIFFIMWSRRRWAAGPAAAASAAQ